MKSPSSIQKQEGRFFYTYRYDAQGHLVRVQIKEKGRWFKKNYGSYLFDYQDGRLSRQISQVEGLGVTESILYHYDHWGRLTEKLYYDQKEQLRYRVTLEYGYPEAEAPFRLEVTRMEKFLFFKTENLEWMKEFLAVTGQDFEGSFFLLDLIEKSGYRP